MIKKFVEHEYDDIGRQYLFDDGTKYYSVTTMIGHVSDKSFLEEWRKRIGYKKAARITKYAGEIGSQMHECLEQYLLRDHTDYPNSVVKNLANQIIPYIDKRVKKVYATEKVLYSDVHKLAGTTDVIASYHMNRRYHTVILDFKTANRQPKVQWIQNYLVQLAIYAMMMEEIYNNKIDYGVLLFAFKKQRNPNREVVVNLTSYKEKALKYIEQFHETIN